jgi:hypothetical protein
LRVSQTIQEISITRGNPTVFPVLAFLLLITAIKDAVEDYHRHKVKRRRVAATSRAGET